ncbi:chorismate-binding protein [Amorphus orientalis]|uniref:Isochorismate synthase n=1 Tax=Amorphus orientalis TaxID=649198 RepID=A0AAE3VP03_9HYPH|nr:chorismate-binding protein [Amorphus orientalis]MDQ0315393.1 isochorismate synthase [Amorphus orientalis]
MILSRTVRALLGAAADTSRPFAVWRRPNASGAESIVGCSAIGRRQIFGDGNDGPFFALNRFVTADANLADAIEGDVLVRGGEITFRAGATYAAGPDTDAQAALHSAAQSRDPDAPIHADDSGVRPVQTDRAAYEKLVKRAVEAIGAGAFRKVVTSRCEARPLPEGQDLIALFEALAAKLPTAYVCLVRIPGEGAWLVGTPETLVSVRDGRLATIALAGTQWAQEAVALADICWPDKIIEEQALVSAYIRRALEAAGFRDHEETGPRTVAAANLVHLRSDFAADVKGEDGARLGDLLTRLHPTSAVLGLPKAPALDFLTAHEGYDRSYYTGFLGPVGFDGATDLFVNLRTAQIIGGTAYLYVGGGIVAQSKPDVEWQETVEKTKTVGTVIDGPADGPAQLSRAG